MPLVSVVMGSKSDFDTMKDAVDLLRSFGIETEYSVVSAHRTPNLMFEYAQNASGRGVEVIIAGAGGAAHLPGMIASLTELPVIGVPVPSKHLNGIDIHPAASGRGKFRGRAPSPGMKYRHYSPVHSSVILFEKGQASGPSIAEARDRLLSSGFTVAMLVTDEARLRKGVVVRLGSSKEPERIAKGLFSALRRLDRSRVDFILAEGIDEKGIGLAVMNRLRRASGGNGPEELENLIALKTGTQR